MIKSIQNAEHYTWGNNCDGWHLVKSDSLSVIQECMPSGTSEKLHFHTSSQQLFYILSGIAQIVIDGNEFSLTSHQSIHIPALSKHKIANMGAEELHFIVISEPKAHGDRINLED